MTGAAGPFIVKRVRQCGYCDGSGSAPYVPGMEHDTCLRCEGEPVSVKAVADLDGAQTAAYEIVQREWRHGPPALGDQPDYEDGRQWARGLDGPGSFTLPGSEIHVEATTYERLLNDLHGPGVILTDLTPDETLLENWNSRFGVAAQEKGGTDAR